MRPAGWQSTASFPSPMILTPAQRQQQNAYWAQTVAESGQQQQDFRNALATYTAMNGPQMAAIQAQRDALLAQRGTANQSAGLRANDLRGGIEAQLAAIGVDRQAGLSDIQALDRQSVLLDQLLGLQNESFANREGSLNSELGFLARNRDLSLQGNDISMRGLVQQAMQDRRGARSDATTRGAYATQGHNQVQGDINAGEQLGKDRLGVERQSILTSYDESTAKVQAELRQTYLDRQEAGLSHTEQKAAIEDRRKQLFYQAQKYGISEDELRRRLDNGLAQLELDRQTSVNQLLSALADNNARQAAAAQQVMQTALQAAQQMTMIRQSSGIPAQFTPQQVAFFTQIENQRRFYSAIAAQQARANRSALIRRF